MKRLHSFFLAAFIFLAFGALDSCTKDNYNTVTDNELFDESGTGSYAYYQNGNLLSGVSPSPHGDFKLRFNSTAQSVLDSSGELPAGTSFPEGSLIVKDIYEGTSVVIHALMKKDGSNASSASGWLWAEFLPDGKAKIGSGRKGADCVSCHSSSPNRDLTRTFDLH